MKLDVIKLDAGKAGSVDLDDAIFGLEPRADILHRVVRWQRAKAQAGTQSTRPRRSTSRKGPAAHVTAPRKLRSSVTVVSSRARPRAATPMTCPRSSGHWV